jgi:acyl-CoA synthetase (AMP-forming)/AMP-acid ligase II
VSESLLSRLRGELGKAPGRKALAFVDARGHFAWRSLEQVHDEAAGHARALADAGLGPGDTCVIVLPSGERSAAVLLGTLLLGAVPLLVAPPTLRGADSHLAGVLTRVTRRARARLVVLSGAGPALAEQLARSGRRPPRVVAGEELRPVAGPTIEPPAVSSTAISLLQLTSGTTGFPRICAWSHAAVLAALDGMALAMELSSDDVCFNWTPLYHDMGLVNNFLLCLVAGVPLAMLSPTDFIRKPALWLRGLSDTQATITWSPNFGFAIATRKVAPEELDGVRLDRVRAFWNAAERIHPETMRAFHARFAPWGVRLDALRTNFGCAENIGGATFSTAARPCPVEQVDAEWLQRTGIARPAASGVRAMAVVSAGRPWPGLGLHILSRAGRPLPDGRVGEVALDTPSRMAGYLGQARESRRALHGRLLRTGDLGYVRDQELFWVGRVRERITVRGRKLDPSDFEHALLATPGLRPGCFAAFGVDDPVRGTQRIVVVVERGDAPRDEGELAAAIRGDVHRQLGVTVDDVVIVRPGTLAKTSSGKRRHRHFRRLYLEGTLHSAGPAQEKST